MRENKQKLTFNRLNKIYLQLCSPSLRSTRSTTAKTLLTPLPAQHCQQVNVSSHLTRAYGTHATSKTSRFTSRARLISGPFRTLLDLLQGSTHFPGAILASFQPSLQRLFRVVVIVRVKTQAGLNAQPWIASSLAFFLDLPWLLIFGAGIVLRDKELLQFPGWLPFPDNVCFGT